ncbi:MAG: putative baseplate assembly protein [Anaerolineae bacterium]|nr:putative baseplate assembly protein [Anaerolineae bacterium]
MPLTLPNLDDRRWTDLVEEGRALIPVYAPRWTDHNIHDPGITLIELFAWLAEMDIYQLNRVPDAHREKFLALIGVEPQPPQASQAVLQLALQPESPPLELPATLEFSGKDPADVVTRFRTLHEVTVVASQLVAVQVYDGSAFHDVAGRLADAGDRSSDVIYPFGDDPQPGAALYFGFDPPLPPHVPATLYFVGADPSSGRDARRRIEDEIRAREAVCRRPNPCAPDDASERDRRHEPARETAPGSRLDHHSVHTMWEFVNRWGEWQRFPEDAIGDHTRCFTLDGRVLLTLPAEMGAIALGEVEAPLPYVRCRFAAGAYDATPGLQTVLVNTVEIEQASYSDTLDTLVPSDLPWRAELLGEGSGLPFQRVYTAERAVITGSFCLHVEEGVWREWERRPDFYASGRADTHYVLDPVTGTAVFGDGEQGRVVPEGARIWASYLATRAEAGNLPSCAVNQLADSAHNRWLLAQHGSASVEEVSARLARITNPLPARGGAAAETLLHAQGRAIEMLAQPTRAVILADYERLARETPGVRLARTFACANLHPAFPCFTAPGVITVVIVPYLPRGRPVPSPQLCRMVASHLDLGRIVGTRVEVVGPSYTRVTVHARVRPCRGVDAAALRQRIVGRLHRFFDSLTGGPAYEGWPFGRDVYRSEVLQVLDDMEGVDHVLSLELLRAKGEASCGNVCIPPLGLVESGRHQIEVEGEPCQS